MILVNSDLLWILSIVTIFTVIMSPTLCWVLTAKYRAGSTE